MVNKLSPRELEILCLMPNHDSSEIARELGIKPFTVRNLKRRIYTKLGMPGGRGLQKRLRAVLKAIELGIVNLREVKFKRIRKSGEVWV